MRAVVQRVKSAKVEVDNKTVGEIAKGCLVLLAVEKEDSEENADKLLEKILNYRMFADSENKMNLSLKDVAGGLLLVSQFTLAADTKKGLRPSFSSAATPMMADELYQYMLQKAKENHNTVEAGVFAADMQVSLLNDGPVTFILEA